MEDVGAPAGRSDGGESVGGAEEHDEGLEMLEAGADDSLSVVSML